MDKRRSRPVGPAVRCALAALTATVAVGAAWQGASASTHSAVASAARGHLKARHHHAVATDADNGRSVTLRRGDTLTVTLSSGWSTPRSSDERTVHDQGAAGFVAQSPGTATIDATRAPSCPPGRMCPMYLQIYRLNVTVTR